VQVTKFHVDLENKPEWFTRIVNPAGQVPAIAYGGPKVPTDQPSTESAKITESLVLLEFVADLYPNSSLLPKDPIARARVRFFIDTVSTKFNPALIALLMQGEGLDKLVKNIEDVQELLPAAGGFAVGSEYTIADAALAPFLGRLELLLKNDIGAFATGEGRKGHAQIFEGQKFARLQQYFKDITSRESWKATFDVDLTLGYFRKRFAATDASE